jgi:hypothetical protein
VELLKMMSMSNFYEFWSENEKGMLSVNNYNFKHFLETENFFKNKPNENSTFNIIKKDGIFLKIKDEWEVKDYVIDFILNNGLGQKVFNLMTGKASLFKRDYLSMIKSEQIQILRDTKDTSYLFYKNGVLEVTKNGKSLKPYNSYGLHIWEDQVINREYIEADHHESEYRKFIWLISGGFSLPQEPTHEDKARYQSAVERYNTFQTVIGYLLHSYNSGGDNKAVILNDEAISDDPNGRSGKGLFWNGLGHLKKVQSLNGKSFNFNAQFPYQSVKTDCQILVWDDVKKNFDFEQLFSVITEGIEITYKGENTIKLPIEESPKILITTNYTIKGKGGSHDARRFEVELSSYFNEKYTPIQEFGHKLFDSWDKEEWARFDCYMIECLKKYLEKGLLPYKAISLPLKKLQVDLTKELYDCIHNATKNDWISFDEFYLNYCSTVKKFTEKTKTFVTQSIKNKYCEFFGYEYEERTSNGVKKFIIKQKGLDKPSDLPF